MLTIDIFSILLHSHMLKCKLKILSDAYTLQAQSVNDELKD